MISTPLRVSRKLTYPFGIGDLREIRTGVESADLGRNWSFAILS